MTVYTDCPEWNVECPYFHHDGCTLKDAETECDAFDLVDLEDFDEWD